MKSQITLAQLAAIYESKDVFLSERNALEMLVQCNEQADAVEYHVYTGEPLPVRSAIEWAVFFADQEAHQNMCEGLAHAQFCRDAYGE